MNDTQIKQIEELAIKVSKNTGCSYRYAYNILIGLTDSTLEQNIESNLLKQVLIDHTSIFDIKTLKEDKNKSYGNKYIKRKYRH